MTGVGLLSGFGTPEGPPDYDLDAGKKAIQKTDTHPGTGIKHLDGKAGNPGGRLMLGEKD